MNPFKPGPVLGLCLSALVWAPVQADPMVFDGGEPDQQSAFFGDAKHDTVEAATRFVLTDPLRFDGIEWWGLYYPGGTPDEPDDFTLDIYSAAVDLPDALIATAHLGAVNREATGQTVTAFDEFIYRATLAEIALAPGEYFIALGNDYLGGDLWAWETTSTGAELGGATFFAPGGYWSADEDANLAFRLLLPEPGTLALLVLGAAGLGAGRARVARAGRG